MDFSVIVSFLLLTVPSLYTPGPNNLMLLSSSAKFGFVRTIRHGSGIVIGFTLIVFLVGLGLGEIFVTLPWLQSVLKYAAAIYFCWLAYKLLGLKLSASEDAKARPMTFMEAALFQWINPKVWVIGPSFVAAFLLSGDQRYFSLFWIVLGTFLVSITSTLLWMTLGDRMQAFLVATGLEKHLGKILAGLMLVAVILFLLP